MGVHGGPDIVEDGLVFAIDAGNGQSYVSGSLKAFDLVSSNTGSLINQAQYSPVGNGSFAFDGSDDSIEFVSPVSLDTTHTISVWVIYIGNNRIVLGGTGEYAMFITGTNVYTHPNGGGYNNKSIPTIGDGNWHHICLSRDGSTMTWYHNGADIGTSTEGGTCTVSTIGAYSGGSYSYYGKITSIQLYNKALTASEVLQNYNATKERFI